MAKFVGLLFVLLSASVVFAESPIEHPQKSLGTGYRGVNSGHGPVQQAIELDPNALMNGQRHYAQALYPQPQTQHFLSSPYQGLAYQGVVQAPKNYQPQPVVTQTKAVSKVPQALRLEQFQGPASYNAIGQGKLAHAHPLQYLPQFANPGVIYGRPVEGPAGPGPEGPIAFGQGPYEFAPGLEAESGPAFFHGQHQHQPPAFYVGQSPGGRHVQYAKEAGPVGHRDAYNGQIIGHAYPYSDPSGSYPKEAAYPEAVSHVKEGSHGQYSPPAVLKEVASYRPSPSVVKEVGHYPPSALLQGPRGAGPLPFYARGYHPEFM